jgi:Bax protein
MKNKIILSSLVSLLLMGTALLNASTTPLSTKHYSVSSIPKNMTVQEKKQRFFALLVPAVNQVYKELETKYTDTKELIKKDPTNPKIVQLMKEYSAKNPQDLLARMKPHPKSITLAQSAMESAWGTSRFLRVANNVFGVWSFNKNEPRVPAGKKRGKKTIYVKKYASISDSIKDYYRILATGKVFNDFRNQKMKTNDPYILVKHLDKYSERGAEYGKELTSMIRYNKLKQYDAN